MQHLRMSTPHADFVFAYLLLSLSSYTYFHSLEARTETGSDTEATTLNVGV